MQHTSRRFDRVLVAAVVVVALGLALAAVGIVLAAKPAAATDPACVGKQTSPIPSTGLLINSLVTVAGCGQKAAGTVVTVDAALHAAAGQPYVLTLIAPTGHMIGVHRNSGAPVLRERFQVTLPAAMDTNGTWSLMVSSDVGWWINFVGTLDSWSVFVGPPMPVPGCHRMSNTDVTTGANLVANSAIDTSSCWGRAPNNAVVEVNLVESDPTDVVLELVAPDGRTPPRHR
jgi:hypothetical protein